MPLFIGATPVSTGAAPLLHLALAKPWLALNEGLNAMKFASTAWVPILSRTLAAWVGGYAFTYAFTAALARLLPLDNVDALIVASLLSFVIYTFAILWAFAARHQGSAWMGAVLALPLAAIGFWPQWMERLT